MIERHALGTIISTIVYEDSFQTNRGFRLHFINYSDWRRGHRSPHLLFCAPRIVADVGPPSQTQDV